MDSVHHREDRERQSPAQVRTDRLHHGGDSRADHVVREGEMRQAPPDRACRLALTYRDYGSDRSGLSRNRVTVASANPKVLELHCIPAGAPWNTP